MAKNTSTVYLGFEDECVSDKNKHLMDFTTNKVGGQPVREDKLILFNWSNASGCINCG